MGVMVPAKLRHVVLLLALVALGSGCTQRALPIAVFAAAAAVQTVQAVDAYCSRDDVDCAKSPSAPGADYERHEDPFSAGVDW